MIELTAGELLASITVLFLAVFLGFELISKVPPTLHTPLMSGSNAISGITLVGAVLAAGATNGTEGTIYTFIPPVPTLSQWGIIMLALKLSDLSGLNINDWVLYNQALILVLYFFSVVNVFIADTWIYIKFC